MDLPSLFLVAFMCPLAVYFITRFDFGCPGADVAWNVGDSYNRKLKQFIHDYNLPTNVSLCTDTNDI